MLTAVPPGATEDKPGGALIRGLGGQGGDDAAGIDARPPAPALDRFLRAHPGSKVARISSPQETEAEPGTLTRHFSHESDAAHTEAAPLAVEPSPDKTLQHDAFDAHGNILQEASHASFNEGADANAEGRQTSERTTASEAAITKEWCRSCDCCGANGSDVTLKPCAKCMAAHYCGRECQVQHWKHGGHKQACNPQPSRAVTAERSELSVPRKHALAPEEPLLTSSSASRHDSALQTKADKKLLAKVCANCEASECTLECSRCKLVSYCSRPCQVQHWSQGFHKRFCVTPEERSASLAAQTPSTADNATSRECMICRQPLDLYFSSFLPCSHSFHAACVEDLRSFADAKVCPECREPLPSSPEVLFQEARQVLATVTSAASLKPALIVLRTAAAQGHAQAQVELGFMYMLGIGVPRNYGIAKRWLRRAAEQGHAHAQLELGCCAFEGAVFKDSDFWLSRAEDSLRQSASPFPEIGCASSKFQTKDTRSLEGYRYGLELACFSGRVLLSKNFWVSATKAGCCCWEILRPFRC